MRSFLFVIAVMFSSMCFANWSPADEDLENCKWRDGHEMSEKQCTDFRAEVESDKSHQKMQEDYHEQFRLQEAKREAEKAKQRAIVEEENQKRIAEMARQEAETKRYREQLARDEAKEDAVKKRKCGKDYNTLRIGMTLDHLEQCVGATYATKTVGKGGVVETYRTTFDWVHVQNGRVISYTERTDN